MAKPAKPSDLSIPEGGSLDNRIHYAFSFNKYLHYRITRWGRALSLLWLISMLVACSLESDNVVVEKAATEYSPEGSVHATDYPPLIEEVRDSRLDGLDCGNSPPIFVTDLKIYQTPVLDEPPARVPFRDPIFDTCLVRVTDRNTDFRSDDPPLGLKNEYSRVQSFNADGSLILVFSITGNWYVYNGSIFSPLGQVPVSVEPRWDVQDPDLLYYIEEGKLMAYRISSGSTQVIHDFALDFPGQKINAVWTRYEGSPSKDTRYWGLMVDDEEWYPVALLIYDIEVDQVIAKREVDNTKDIDSVTISPSGNYFLAFHDDYCEPGELGDENNPCGLMVYDQHLQNGRGLLRIIGHSDLALDENGQEVLVFQDIDTDHISMLNLESGAITPLWPIDFSYSALGFHFSGNAYQLPGWVLVSTSNGNQPSATWMDDQVFALELKQGGRVVRLAHTHSLVDESQEHDYWAEPHASVNQDFTRILFTSNWGRSGTGEVDMYLIELPPDWALNLSHE